MWASTLETCATRARAKANANASAKAAEDGDTEHKQGASGEVDVLLHSGLRAKAAAAAVAAAAKTGENDGTGRHRQLIEATARSSSSSCAPVVSSTKMGAGAQVAGQVDAPRRAPPHRAGKEKEYDDAQLPPRETPRGGGGVHHTDTTEDGGLGGLGGLGSNASMRLLKASPGAAAALEFIPQPVRVVFFFVSTPLRPHRVTRRVCRILSCRAAGEPPRDACASF